MLRLRKPFSERLSKVKKNYERSVTMDKINQLAKGIHDFLYNYDPCFGYAEGLIGEQNEVEWRQTIAANLATPEGFQMWVERISELIVEVPESESDGDELLCSMLAA